MTRSWDPHLDPLRSPSARGHHPHTLRSMDEDHNPQDMYERRGPMGEYQQAIAAQAQAVAPPRPAPPPPPPQQKPLLNDALVLLGLGGLAVWAVLQLTKDKEEPRRNPVAGSSPVIVQTAPPQAIVAQPTSSQPQPQTSSAPTVKKRRVRRTTQARGPDGTFLPSGTRKRAITEGKEKK